MRYRVGFGCVIDGNPVAQRRAVLLLASLRSLGGEYAHADFYLCVMGPMDPALGAIVSSLGAHVVQHPPASASPLAANTLRFLLLPELAQYDYAVLLDCDTAIVASPAGLFGGAGVRGCIANACSVPAGILTDLCLRCGLPAPRASYITMVTHEPTPISVNSGVIVVARSILGSFVESWARYRDWLLLCPDLLPGCVDHTNQASLTLALIESRVPFEPLDVRFSFPIHRAPRAFWTPDVSRLSPVILQYDATAKDGHLVSSRAVAARTAIGLVNAVWAHWSPSAGWI